VYHPIKRMNIDILLFTGQNFIFFPQFELIFRGHYYFMLRPTRPTPSHSDQF